LRLEVPVTLYPRRRPDRFIRYEVQHFCTQSCLLCAGLVHVLETVSRSTSSITSRALAAQPVPILCQFYAAIGQLASPLQLACVGWAPIEHRASIGRHTRRYCLQCCLQCGAVRAPLFLRQDAGVSHTPSSLGHKEVRKQATLPWLPVLRHYIQPNLQPLRLSSAEHVGGARGTRSPTRQIEANPTCGYDYLGQALRHRDLCSWRHAWSACAAAHAD
jgi:hypothetical protein